MKMKNNISNSLYYNQIYDFINKEISYSINKKTIFFKDLELIGDDADVFMLKFKDKFQIDMTDFKFDEYFIDEYNIPFLYLYDKFFRKEKIKRKEFGVEHLEKILKTKKWINI